MRKIKGRSEEFYFSPEFLALAKSTQVKPDWFAAAILRTFKLNHKGASFVFIGENGPMPDWAFDLEGEGQ